MIKPKTTFIYGRVEYTVLHKNGKIPYNIPARADKFYKEWENWGEFLGTGNVSGKLKKFLPYDEFLLWLKDNNIRSGLHYRNFKKPDYIPTNPKNSYKEFTSWLHIFTRKLDYWDYEKSRKWLFENFGILSRGKIS